MKNRIIELPNESKSGPVMRLRTLRCYTATSAVSQTQLVAASPPATKGLTVNTRSLGLRPPTNAQGSQSKECQKLGVSDSLLHCEACAVAAARVIRQAARREERRFCSRSTQDLQ